MLVILDKNGWVYTSGQDVVYDFVMKVASHKLVGGINQESHDSDLETIAISKWLQQNIRKIKRHELPLHFRKLREILSSYGCKIEIVSGGGNLANIYREKLRCQIGYRNEGSDVDRGSIHKLRKDLQLDEENGFDSDIFYHREARIPHFINKYRKVLNRLAKV